MPCHVPAARVSSHRHRLILPSPSLAFFAVLHLDSPTTRQACDYVRRATSGEHAIWRLLGIGKAGGRLRCVVRWAQQTAAEHFSLIEINLAGSDGLAVSWQDFATAAAALDALRTVPHGDGPSLEGAALEALQKGRDQLRQQLHSAGGAR